MKDLIIKVLLTMLCFYIVGAFGNASFDVTTWNHDARALLAIYMGAGIIGIVIYHCLQGNSKNKT